MGESGLALATPIPVNAAVETIRAAYKLETRDGKSLSRQSG